MVERKGTWTFLQQDTISNDVVSPNENFLLRFQGMKLSAEEFNAIFTFYDRDGNGYIDSNELDALLKDLYEKNKKEMDIKKLTAYKKNILSLSHGGKLYRRELEMILCTEPL
ncbi:hypothetical protein chiPu_0014088 [Chiloscyllium punctatum]|uniref:EF-hand domain-containing protein n=1 Tax=Chiloscyllium punctatum TaxID=137246 RepID=A0A401SYW6_CHIPU|nr:hypothetical protein [Chiloscyllium punctatum]